MAASDQNDRIAFLSTFPPRQCGIATFTKSLISACRWRINKRLQLNVIALDNPDLELAYTDPVKYKFDHRGRIDYVEAAKFLNYSNVRVLSLQHEFGIFGGPDGEYVLDLVRELRCPVVTTLHTVLDKPSDGQSQVMKDLIALSYRLVVMSHKGISFLRDVYDAPREKLTFIPHGVDNLPLVEPDNYKEQFDMSGRRVLLTFGLLSEGKGIETMLRAMPPIVEEHPDICYIVLGATHPEIVKREGEKYRLGLQRLARDLGLQRNVLFIDRFVEQRELGEFLKAADIYVTPYLNREQITSGTLAYALGAGKPVVSTNYWYAEELLDKDRGVLVDVKDEDALTEGVLSLLDDKEKLREMRAKAYEYSRNMVWSQVGQRYVDTFRAAMNATRVRAILPDSTMRYTLPVTGVPRPKLKHLAALTDDTGLFQHAIYSLPNRNHGYTTDDNARALVVVAKFHHLFNAGEARRLLGIYLSFVHYAQRPDGLFCNFMGYDRTFLEPVGSDDCFGRALWGLGYVINKGPEEFKQLATEIMERSISNRELLQVMNPRGKANAILGLYNYLQRYPEAHDIEGKIEMLASKNMELLRHHAEGDWVWFEPAITYDNALLPHSMFLAYEATGNESYLKAGVDTLEFLLDKCRRGNHFSLVGAQGWYPKGGVAAQFDQQPIDACALTEALKAAFISTGNRQYLKDMRLAFDWFMGVNDIEAPLYDFVTGGCLDGLTYKGSSRNQGAESTLCCLLSLLTLIEMYSEQNRIGA